MKQFALVKYFINVGNMTPERIKKYAKEVKSELSIRSELESLDITVSEVFFPIKGSGHSDIVVDMFNIDH